MSNKSDLEMRVCDSCHAALVYPIDTIQAIRDGMFRCELCGHCKEIEKEKYKNRGKPRK